jgi:hypothetical protein
MKVNRKIDARNLWAQRRCEMEAPVLGPWPLVVPVILARKAGDEVLAPNARNSLAVDPSMTSGAPRTRSERRFVWTIKEFPVSVILVYQLTTRCLLGSADTIGLEPVVLLSLHAS